MKLEHGIVIGDKFVDNETGTISQVGNIMIAKSGKIILSYKEPYKGEIKHQEMGEFLRGKTHKNLLSIT